MKYIISERQYNLLSEQRPDHLMPFQPETFGFNPRNPETLRPALQKQGEFFKSLDPHTLAIVLGIGSAFIPFVGPFITAGIGLADAALYYKEGDTKTAGLVAMFSLLPGVGAIANRIPAIGKLGVKGMSALAKKIAKGEKITDSVELAVIDGIKKGTDFVKSSLDAHVKTLAQQAATKPLSSQIKTKLTKIGKEGLKYAGAGVGYSLGFDATTNYFEKKKEEEDLKTLQSKLASKN